MSGNKCNGNVHFDLSYGGAISEWPDNLPGLVCKTPPFGNGNAHRFAQCCSGPVYNITSPTSPDHPAYPMTCAMVCQMDPELNKFNENHPYHYSDSFMCLTNDLDDDDNSSFEVVCDTITVKGKAAPTSFEHTPTGIWNTKSYDIDSDGFPVYPTATSSSDSVIDSQLTTSRELASSTSSSEVLTSSSPSPSISSSRTIATTSMTTSTPTMTTSTSTGTVLSAKKMLLTTLALCALTGAW